VSPNGASVAQAAVGATRVIPGSIDTKLPQALRYTDPARVTELIPVGRHFHEAMPKCGSTSRGPIVPEGDSRGY
jgi:hypothetical protein